MSAVNSWLQAAGRYPLLTPSQELDLAHKIQRGMADDATPQQKRIGKRTKQKMIQSNLRLVPHIAKKYSVSLKQSAALSLEDLLQEGCIGLNRAAEKFDPCAGYKFSTYAFWWISQSITRILEHQSSTIRVPCSVGQLLNKARKAGPDIKTREQLQEYLGVVPATMVTLDNGLRAKQTASLSAPVPSKNGDGTLLVDLIADPQNQPSLDELDWQIAAEALDAALDPADPMTDLLKRRVLDGEIFSQLAEGTELSREGVRVGLQQLKESKRRELHPLRQFLTA